MHDGNGMAETFNSCGQPVAIAIRVGHHYRNYRVRAKRLRPGTPPLELEIIETLLLGNNERTMQQLAALKGLGVSIVMDDFGTGYSSLSYLWKFPFDKIKIDRSFMQNLENSGRDVETVVKSIIALGRELRMRVTVEGVETLNQADFLQDANADLVQGFYFGRPMPASEIGANILADFRKAPLATRPPGSAKIKLVGS